MLRVIVAFLFTRKYLFIAFFYTLYIIFSFLFILYIRTNILYIKVYKKIAAMPPLKILFFLIVEFYS